MSQQQATNMERERQQRIASIVSARGLNRDNMNESFVSEDFNHLNTERILEDNLDKQEQLEQEIQLLNNQIDQLEADLSRANEKIHAQEDESVDLKKQLKKSQFMIDEAEDKLNEANAAS